MNFLNKMERKLGRFAISNLIIFLIAGYAIGYTMSLIAPAGLAYMTLEPYYILHGQVWRLFSWVLVPPQGSLIFLLIMMFFYYQLGQALERTWGVFRFNVYIFGGILLTVLGSFLLYFVYMAVSGSPVVGMGSYFSTNYINMSIFLAFAACYPEMEIRLYFLIPIKMKWMAAVYGVLLLMNIIQGNWFSRVAIIMSILNFVIFYFSTRNYSRMNFGQAKRRQQFRQQMHHTVRTPQQGDVTKHKCAVCGRTEKDGANLEFRFCSKCEGNYEYCQDHLFTHEHFRKH